MRQIGIVIDTGSGAGNMVLRGVYGDYVPNAEIEGGVGQFRIAPEFGRISHLFSYLEAGTAPVVPTSVATLEVEDHMVDVAKALLMNALAINWARMYSERMPQQPGVLAEMFKGESARVAAGAKQHLTSMGMRSFLVPVTCTLKTDCSGAYVRTERDLVGMLDHTRAENVVVAMDQPVTDMGTEALATAFTVSPRDEAPEPAPGNDASVTPAPQWADFQGIEANVKGTMVVVAPTAELAREAAHTCLAMAAHPQLRAVPTLVVESITSVTDRRLYAQDGDPDFDDDGDSYSDRDRG